MRPLSLVVLLLCSLSVSATPDIATDPAPLAGVAAADDADYQALQQQADLARDLLAQAQGQRIALAQLPVN